MLCGLQGAGKTSFYADRFLASHVRISRDLLRTAHRETRFLELCLETGQPFVVDKINATPDARAPYVDAARRAGFRTIAWHVDTLPRDAIARNAARDERSRVPVPAILGTQKELVPPAPEEGFDEVWRAWADGRGGFHVERRAGAGTVAPAGDEARFTRGAPATR